MAPGSDAMLLSTCLGKLVCKCHTMLGLMDHRDGGVMEWRDACDAGVAVPLQQRLKATPRAALLLHLLEQLIRAASHVHRKVLRNAGKPVRSGVAIGGDRQRERQPERGRRR